MRVGEDAGIEDAIFGGTRWKEISKLLFRCKGKGHRRKSPSMRELVLLLSSCSFSLEKHISIGTVVHHYISILTNPVPNNVLTDTQSLANQGITNGASHCEDIDSVVCLGRL